MPADPRLARLTRRPVRSLLCGAALGVLIGTAGCTPAPSPENRPSTTTPSSSAPSTTAPSAGAGAVAECPELPATVPPDEPASGTFSAGAGGSAALERTDGGTSSVTGARVSKTGDAAASSGSSARTPAAGAAVLVAGGSRLALRQAAVDSAGAGATGLLSSGTGSLLQATDTTVTSEGSGAAALAAADGGAVTGTNLTLSGSGENANAVTVSDGGGQVTLNRSTATAEAGPAVSPAGDVSVCAVAATSGTAEAAVVEGTHTLTSTRSTLAGATHGVRLVQSSDGSEGASLTVSGGSLDARNGQAVLIDGTAGTVAISEGAKLGAGSETLILVTGGGAGTVTISGTGLDGNLAADPGSTMTLSLSSDSSVTGTLTNTGLALDNTSTVSLRADSTATTVAGALLTGTAVTNITGNGHTLAYDPAAAENAYLNGGTYDLAQGGQLVPSGG